MGFMNRTAPAVAVACAAFVLAACGGGGGSDGGSSGGNANGSSGGGSSPYVLFASDSAGDVAAFTTLSPATASTVGANVVETLAHTGHSLAYDAGHDELYVLYNDVFTKPYASLEVFAHASTMKAGAAPARTVILPDLLGADHIVLDTLHDRLWLSGSDTGSQGMVAVYDHASTLTGTAAVSRTLKVSTGTVAVDVGRDILYLNSFGDEIEVYTNASTLSGDVRPDHVIRGVSDSDSLVLDAGRDTIYAMSPGSSNIYVMHGVSTATSVTPATITLPAGANLYTLSIDATHDRLYAGGQDAAYVIDNVSTLAPGTAPAAKVLATGVIVSAFAFAGQ